MARPSSYTEELGEKICELLSKGVPMARIADMEGMPGYSTMRRWEDENPAFRALSLRARRDGTHYLGEDSLRIADDKDIDPQHKKIMIDTRLRLIGKWNAKEYGEKIDLTHAAPDGGPVKHVIETVIVDPRANSATED